MGRSPCCYDQASLKKGPWTTEEDDKLVSCVKKHGHGNWREIPKLGGLNRCSKSCRLRWTNYLRPDIKRGKFSDEEEQTIIDLHSVLGNKWSTIASRLPGRTDNEIKNYWNTHIRKKLIHMGIDPVTHQPRPNVSLISNLPNLLAMAATAGRNMAAPPLNGDAAQLATHQLVQTLVQVLAGSSSSPAMMGPDVRLFPHNNHDNMSNYLQPWSSSTQDPNLYCGFSIGGVGGSSGGGGEVVPSGHVEDGLLSNVFNVETNTNINNSIATTNYSSSTVTTTATNLVSNSPEENLAVDQNQINEFGSTICTPTISDSSRGVLDIDDLTCEHYWKEFLDQTTWPSLL